MHSGQPGTIRSGPRAFTLIELLVVIAIISLLVAMLLPALKKAKAMTRAVACSSNQRTISLAFNMYAEDNARLVTAWSPYYRDPPGAADYWGNYADWVGLLQKYYGSVQGGLCHAQKKNILNNKVLTCPEDTPAGTRRGSYGVPWNVTVVLDIRHPINFGAGQQPSAINFERAKRPGEMVILSDMHGRVDNTGQVHKNIEGYMLATASPYVAGSRKVHTHPNYQQNFAFFDGHVELRKTPPHAMGNWDLASKRDIILLDGTVIPYAKTTQGAFQSKFGL